MSQIGDVPKRLKGADSKSARAFTRRGGSNPLVSVIRNRRISNSVKTLVFTRVFLFVYVIRLYLIKTNRC